MNSYRFYDEVLKGHIRNINIHHDASGRYPQTEPDYPEEEQVLSEGRKPLDDLHAFLEDITKGGDRSSDCSNGRSSDHDSDRWKMDSSDVETGTMMDLDAPGSV
jgi:hypothetical protein